MKKTGKWLLSVGGRVLVVLLVILILPYVRNILHIFLPDVTGEVRTQSEILEQKLLSSNRLEVTSVDEEGVLQTETRVVLLGTVGTTTIRYRYTASIGIDLRKVEMTADTDRIIFSLPDPEILNDGIEAIEIKRNNLFSRAIDRTVESLLNEQRIKCRETYVMKQEHTERIWADTVTAFEETIAQWLEQCGDRHYETEFIRITDQAAGSIPAA